MAINQPIQPFPYSNQTAGIGGMPYNTGAFPGVQPQQYGQPVNGSPATNYLSQPGLSIVSVTSDDQITNYPVASGNTVAFVNFNTNRLCFKSTNVNGMPMQPRWARFTYDEETPAVQTPTANNQNDRSSVSREEFDELRGMLTQTLNMMQQQEERQYRGRQPKNTYNNGGKRNDRSENVSADDQ